MPPFNFSLEKESPFFRELLDSTMIVAIQTKSKLIQAKLVANALVLTFDKELSQSDIVHVLKEGLPR